MPFRSNLGATSVLKHQKSIIFYVQLALFCADKVHI